MINNLFNNFVKNWPTEKAALNQIMESNKLWNANYRAQYNLTTKDNTYKKNKRSLQVSKNNTASLLLKKIPNEVFNQACLLEAEYKIQGSLGKGNISEIPWICLFDKEVTQSAETGFYIVYLIKADLSGCYLSLNQGWTQYEKAFSPKALAKSKIKKNAEKLRKSLKTVVNFSIEEIELNGVSDLAKGYELGNICSKYYDFSQFPQSNNLINDLQKLIGLYRELKSLVGSNIIDIDLILDEEEFQQRAQSGEINPPKIGKVPKKKKTHNSSSTTWLRDPDMSFIAITNANFECENDPSHKTFLSPVTSKQFVEAHHLIPMEFQDEFETSIDIPENIISLCPNCHRAFHNSLRETKTTLIKKFFKQRKHLFKEREIELSESQLLDYYRAPLSS